MGMEINQKQCKKITKYLPRQRGNVNMNNLPSVNAIFYITENSCKRRALPKSHGNWHTVYTHMNRWSKNGVLQRLFEAPQQGNAIRIKYGSGMPGQDKQQSASHRNRGFKKVENNEVERFFLRLKRF